MDARFNFAGYQYDKLGRVREILFGDDHNNMQYIDYVYDTAPKGRGKIDKIKIDGVEVESFIYDPYSRLLYHRKTIDNISYLFDHRYNTNGQLETLTYPDGFKVKYTYFFVCYLNKILDCNNNNKLIYEAHTRNEFGAITQCSFGNDLASAYTYDIYGELTRIKTGTKAIGEEAPVDMKGSGGEGSGSLPFLVNPSVLNYSYSYNNRGLMTLRNETVGSHVENFNYDNLDRLTQYIYRDKSNVMQTQTFTYENKGNIKTNSELGTYDYNDLLPHGVYNIVSPSGMAATDYDLFDIAYNFYNQPFRISNINYEIELFYGADQQRNKAIFSEGNTRYYISKYYEEEAYPQQDIRRKHYIYGDAGAVALHVVYEKTGTDSLYYIHTDHLGSYMALTNAAKQVKLRNWFDPWGNLPQDDMGRIDTTPAYIPVPITARGFTGHEHYPNFNFINMLGRLYDPKIGQFFSPDNFVQLPEFTQSYNRYSYCLNNPLKYTDPSGETWYDVNGERKFIDDGVDDDMAIKVSQMQFRRLERRFEKDRNYEVYRNKLADINGYTTTHTIFGNFSEFSKNGSGVVTLPAIEVRWHKPNDAPGAARQDYSGIWGVLNYFWNGGIADGFKHNYDGQVIGVAPIMGNPPIPAFKGGNVVKSVNQLNKLVNIGKAPKTITRFDPIRRAGDLKHVHFSNGSALNLDGTWRHGVKILTNEEINFLQLYGWPTP
jgi:RHS repeat-associated protein